MKKIVNKILFTNLDNNRGVWYEVPMIPASASWSCESTQESAGRLLTTKLSFRMANDVPGIDGNISMVVYFDDGSKVLIGTNDLPARLDVTYEDIIKCSCTWKTSK